jgi:hypothetical protein
MSNHIVLETIYDLLVDRGYDVFTDMFMYRADVK